MFELTKIDGTGGIFIAPDHVVCIEWRDGGKVSVLTLVTGRQVEVDEDPEELWIKVWEGTRPRPVGEEE